MAAFQVPPAQDYGAVGTIRDSVQVQGKFVRQEHGPVLKPPHFYHREHARSSAMYISPNPDNGGMHR